MGDTGYQASQDFCAWFKTLLGWRVEVVKRPEVNAQKEELVHRGSFVSRAEAAGAIFDDIETFYNRERLHSAFGFYVPRGI